MVVPKETSVPSVHSVTFTMKFKVEWGNVPAETGKVPAQTGDLADGQCQGFAADAPAPRTRI